jgi:UDP-glucose 4-epimerase
VTVAVIGSRGFIGRPLVAALQAANSPVVEFPSAKPFLRPDGSPTDELAAATTVCYLASRINPAVAERQPGAAADHLASLQRLLDALADSGARVIYPSSGGTVYDTTQQPPYAETSALKPIGRFGATKVEAERLIASARGIEGVAMRISNTYGPGQRTGTGLGVVAHWLAAAAEGQPLRMFGAPATTRDFIYVDDVCDAFLRVISHERPPSVVNIGSGTPTSLGELAETVREVVGGVDIVQEPDRGFDVARSWLDVTLARRTLGWRPTTGLREGIRRAWSHEVQQLRQEASA